MENNNFNINFNPCCCCRGNAGGNTPGGDTPGGTTTGDTPIGHILAYMGTQAPENYLICDGTEYNITDYPELSEHFQTQFESVNFFGGDGTATFAVPDLRGEFLRGSGASTRDTGTGANVGVHQEPTKVPHIGGNRTGIWWIPEDNGPEDEVANCDKWILSELGTIGQLKYANKTGNDSVPGVTNFPIGYTTRPTNTAVLYCIKCR